MAGPNDLLSLIDTLGKTHSPSSKLRILGRSWKLLRNLTPRQRDHLFAAQGLKQAGRLLRRVDAENEKIEEVLESLADRLEKADAAEKLGDLVRRVRRRGVSEVVQEELDHLKEEVLGTEEMTRQARPEPVVDIKIDARPLDLDPEQTKPPSSPPPRGEVREPTRPEPVELPEEEESPLPEDSAVAPPEPAAQSEPVPQPPAEPVVAEVVPPFPVQPAQAGDALEDLEEVAGERTLAAKLAREERLIDRFRVVRTHLAGLSRTGDVDRALEQFPPGWARRRFVTQLIRDGDLSFESACRLLEKLSESGEGWAVSAILGRYSIDSRRRARLLETVRTPLARRKIALHSD